MAMMACVKPIYPGGSDRDPDAEPSACPEPEFDADVPSATLEVEGEVFAIRPDKQSGTRYMWLSGPNPGYGFGISPTRNLSLDEHRDNIRGFLSDIDPVTGYLRDD